MKAVLDTSIALNLCWLGLETLLFAIYSEVFAPGEVKREFERKVATDARFAGLRFPKAITVVEPASIPPLLLANRNLDPGEIAVLALALERGIPEVLLDERAGRRALGSRFASGSSAGHARVLDLILLTAAEIALACSLFAAGRVTRGVAARIVGLDALAFDEELTGGESPSFTDDMLNEDLAAAEGRKPTVETPELLEARRKVVDEIPRE